MNIRYLRATLVSIVNSRPPLFRGVAWIKYPVREVRIVQEGEELYSFGLMKWGYEYKRRNSYRNPHMVFDTVAMEAFLVAQGLPVVRVENLEDRIKVYMSIGGKNDA